MKMAVESMEKPSGGTSPSRRRAGTETPVPQILASRWRRLWKVFSGFVERGRGFTSVTTKQAKRRSRKVNEAVTHQGGAAPPLAAPGCGVGPPGLPSGGSQVFWMVPGKIGTWALISSDSENISLLGFLKPKTAENSNWHFGILLIGQFQKMHEYDIKCA